MAIEYSFKLGGVADTEQVSELFKQTSLYAGMADQIAKELNFKDPGIVLDSGVLVLVSALQRLTFPDPVEEEFGITPTVYVLFRFDKSADPEVQRIDMVRLVSDVLIKFSGDAVLAFAGEIVFLLRQGGRLKIKDEDGFWRPEVLALLPEGYERASLPVL